MQYLRAALARIAGMFTGHRADDDLRDELQAHLEMETAEYIRRGMRPDEARRRAILASGGVTQAAEAVSQGLMQASGPEAVDRADAFFPRLEPFIPQIDRF